MAQQQRARRTRYHIRRSGRVRLSVFRAARHMYAQVIDDARGVTVASASTLGSKESGGNMEAARTIGKQVAEKALAAGVKEVVFDRGPYLYHGRVSALADAAREAGLSF